MSTVSAPMVGGLEPAWEVALLFPPQGEWTEREYLALTAGCNRLVEFTDGRIEVLAMPTKSHQLIVRALLDLLRAFVEPRMLGEVLFAPLRVRVAPKKFREPDIVFMRAEHDDRAGEEYWEGADLVMEVVSPDPDSRQRDIEEKPRIYAAAGIGEYWIIDPQEQQITVLTLRGTSYEVSSQGGPGQRVQSRLLDGFEVDVASVLAAGKP